MNRLLLNLLFLAFSLASLNADCAGFADLNQSRLNLEYAFGKFISIEENYGKAELFLPFYGNNCWQTFVDASLYRFNNKAHCKDKWAGSAGIGFRSHLCDSSVMGINLFYDFREGRGRHDFNQIGCGLEWLNCCWDIRVNGYLPLSKKSFTNKTRSFDTFSNGFFARKRNLEWAATGCDAELGIPFFKTSAFNLYGAAGSYYYSRKHREHFFGGFARLELDWRSIVTLEGRYSYDKIHHSCFQGIIELTIPFDCCTISGFCHKLLDRPVQRNGIIQTDHCCDWRWNWRRT